MNKSKELMTTTAIVKEVLEKYPKARNSDDELCYWVYATIGMSKGIDIHTLPTHFFLLRKKEMGFPPTKSIERARRRIRRLYPELAGNSEVEGYRSLNEEIFKDYARRTF